MFCTVRFKLRGLRTNWTGWWCLCLLFLCFHAGSWSEATMGVEGGMKLVKFLVFFFNFIFWVCSADHSQTYVVPVKMSALGEALFWLALCLKRLQHPGVSSGFQDLLCLHSACGVFRREVMMAARGVLWPDLSPCHVTCCYHSSLSLLAPP